MHGERGSTSKRGIYHFGVLLKFTSPPLKQKIVKGGRIAFPKWVSVALTRSPCVLHFTFVL